MEIIDVFLEKLSEISSLSDIAGLTDGEKLFLGGFALAAFTVLLALIFLIFRPKYKPESATYVVGKEKKPKKSRKNEKARDAGTTVMADARTELIDDARTELIDDARTELTGDGGGEAGATEFVDEASDDGKTEIL